MSGNSWVTLATNDSYSLGALVLACSLKRTGTVHNLTVLVTPGVSSSMRNQLCAVFNVVQEVNILDSKDEKNLALLTRPELGVTFTKIHCWRLTQFSKCVFLDADVLVLRNCDELFDREELSAAPDVGWPDCFNSGVFVYRPSIETYNAIINLALSQGSFDGGDQGLLNQYFSDWATKDIGRHLPFIYNMCSSATYSYLPAFKQFGQDVKIVHFIGSSKPWLQYLDSETRQVRPTLGSEHLQGLLQLWWDIFCNDIHSKLSPDMAGLAGALSQLTLGVARSPEQIALEEHLRKQAWEHGNVDYMGRDSFDNIWQKICQTLAEPLPDPLREICELPSQVSGDGSVISSQEVTSNDGVSLTTSQLPCFIGSENKEIGNISVPSIPSPPDTKLGIGSDTALGDVSSSELKDAPVESKGVPNSINTDLKISESLESSDVSELGTLPLSDIAPEDVVSGNSVPTPINVSFDTSKVSNIMSHDTEVSESKEVRVPASSCPITKINTTSDTLEGNVDDVCEAGIGSVVSSEAPILSSGSKMSESEERMITSPQSIDSLPSKSKTEIVDNDSGNVPKLDSPPVPKDEVTKLASPTSVPVETNPSTSVSSLDSSVLSGLHSSSDCSNQTKTSLTSETDAPSSPLASGTTTETSDMLQKVNIPDASNDPPSPEITDTTLTTCDTRTESETPSTQQDSLLNIPEAPDQPSFPYQSSEIIGKTLTTCDSSTERQTPSTQQDSLVNIPESPDQHSLSDQSPEITDKTLTTDNSRTEPQTPSTEQDSLVNIPESPDQGEIADKISITSGTISEPETHSTLKVNIPASSDLPPSSDIKDETPVTRDTRQKAETPSTQQDVITSVSEIASTVTKAPLDLKDSSKKSKLSKVPSGLEVPEGQNQDKSVETAETSQSVNVIEPTPPTSPSDSVLQTIASSDSNILSIDSSIPETPPVGSQSSPIPQDPSNVTTAPSITSPVPESSASSETSQTVDPQAPVPPKRRHRPSQKVQKGKK